MERCPSRRRLSRYERGELGDGSAGPIEAHVARCPSCARRVEALRRKDADGRLLRAAFSDSVDLQVDRPGMDHPGATGREGASTGKPDGGRGAPGARSAGATVRDVERGVQVRRLARGSGVVLPGEVHEATGAADAGEATGDWLIPDYERVRVCGEGAYGSVWAVRDRVGVYRALKIIDMKKMRQAKVGCRESTALETYCRRVGRHPYLIDVYHVGMVGDQLYYTMELADNDLTKAPVRGTFPTNYRPLTLYTVIQRRRIRADTAIEIARRLLRGLAKLHSLDLVHRDIKPANIVFVKKRPKLADIGMVTPGSDSHSVIGTPRYMPPDRIIDRTADTYAIAKVLHEMITGMKPSTFPALPAEYLGDSIKWDLSRVSDLIVRACSPNAADRYASAADLLDDLEACADFPFRSLFDDLIDPGRSEPTARVSVRSQILMGLVRGIPWIAGLIAVILILRYLGE